MGGRRELRAAWPRQSHFQRKLGKGRRHTKEHLDCMWIRVYLCSIKGWRNVCMGCWRERSLGYWGNRRYLRSHEDCSLLESKENFCRQCPHMRTFRRERTVFMGPP